MASDATHSVRGVTSSVILLSTLTAVAGLAIVVGPGYLNPLHFWFDFVMLGTVCFFVPGVLGVVGGIFLRRECRGWTWSMASGGILLQLIFAIGFFVGQFFLSPISPVPLVLCAVWAAAAGVLSWRLSRLHGAIRSDAVAHRGFDVQAPPAAQIDSVREK